MEDKKIVYEVKEKTKKKGTAPLVLSIASAALVITSGLIYGFLAFVLPVIQYDHTGVII